MSASTFEAEFGDAVRDSVAILLAADQMDFEAIDCVFRHADHRNLTYCLAGIALSCFRREGRITGETTAAIIEGMRERLAPLRGL